MKRKLLATLLALCLIVGMIPVAASAAEETVNTAAELTDALANAIDGDTIRLGDDIVLDPTYAIKNDEYTEEEKEDGPPIPYFTIDHSIVLDLNGHTISWDVEKVTTNSQDIWYTLLLFAVDGAEVTICGNGTIETEANYSNSYGINIVNNGSLTIENGTFTGATSAIQVQTGSLVITGGTFKQAKTIGSVASQYAKYVVNAIDANYKNGTAKIALKGGEYCYDYSNFPEGTNTTYVADGYVMETSSGETGMYTVSPKTEKTDNDVAVVDGQYFTQLQNAINAAVDDDTVELLKDFSISGTSTLDLNGKTVETKGHYLYVGEGSNITITGNGTFVNNEVVTSNADLQDIIQVAAGGKLTIENGTFNSKGAQIFKIAGEVTIEDGTFTCTATGEEIEEIASKAMIQASGETAVLNFNAGTLDADTKDAANARLVYGIYAANGATVNLGAEGTEGPTITSGYAAVGFNNLTSNPGPEINIHSGNYSANLGDDTNPNDYKFNSVLYLSGQGTVTISGGNFSSDGTATRIFSIPYTNVGLSLNITGGTFNSTNCKNLFWSGGETASATATTNTISISGGNFQSTSTNFAEFDEGNTFEKFISGGYFTSDPSEYLAEDLMTVTSDVPGYAFTVSEAVDTDVDVSAVSGAPVVDVPKTIPEDAVKTVKEAAQSVEDSGELSAAANSVLSDITQDQVAEAKEAIKAEGSGVTVEPGDTVNIYAQTYLSVTPTGYDSTNKTLTMDITPMYRVVASTEENPEDIKVVGEVEENEQPNAVVLENSEKELNIRTMTITLTLPSGFVSANGTVYIQHKGYEYSATADASGEITFTNPHGFSEFTFSTEPQAVAEIDGTSYTSLQAAVDDATANDIIVIIKDTGALSATANKTVKVMNGTEKDSIDVTINGVSRTIGKNATETFVCTSGGGAPEEPTWPFTDVTEGDDWFYDAVAYVYENGIMAGTDETTFEPYMELDRAMAAQLFYNLEGKPAVTGDSAFTDVTSGHWAVDAITWAAQNDIVAGIGGGLYDPDSNVTREQFAVMLYKYARFKGYDLTATGDLTQFPDAGSISGWAETALSWANGKGLINGHENGTIDPKGSTIRAQAASIMANFDQNVAK